MSASPSHIPCPDNYDYNIFQVVIFLPFSTIHSASNLALNPKEALSLHAVYSFVSVGAHGLLGYSVSYSSL